MQSDTIVRPYQQLGLPPVCAALDVIEDHIAVIDSDGVILFANVAWRQFGATNGAPEDAFVGQNYIKICEAVTGDEGMVAHLVGNGLRKLLAGERPTLVVDYPCLSGDELLWFRLRAVVYQYQGARYAAVSHRDITPRVAADTARRASEERHRLIWEATNDAMAISDAAGIVLDANPAYLRLYGGTREETVGASFARIFPEEQRRWAEEVYRETFWTQPTGMLFESAVRTEDGDDRVVESRIDFVEREGVRVGMLSVIRDITAHKQAMVRLAEQETLFRLIFEQSPLGMALVGLDFRFLRVNEAFCRITGYDAEELLAHGFPAITHPDDVAGDVEQAQRLAAGTIDRYTLEKRYVRKDGRSIWVRLHGSLLRNAEGALSYYLAQVEDITAERAADEQRLRVEQQLQEAQRLESLGLLAGGIAHDFNNLLTVIIGNTHVAMSELQERGEARATLVQIEQAAQRAADLTRQILAYAGRGRFVVEPVELNQLIMEISHLLHASVARSVELRFNLSGNLRAVEADPTQLRQVVMNLVINASEAIGDKPGSVTIATQLLSAAQVALAGLDPPQDREASHYVILEVTDTGVGIDPSTLRRIFEPFFTTKFTGRGLGLAAVQGIARRHHGSLSVRSEVGHGATFTLALPALAQEVPARAGLERIRPSRWRGLVLVIEDEPEVRALLVRLLERAGFEVLSVAEGRAGIELFRTSARHLRCVFLDLTMPGMNGEEVFHELKGIDPSVPIVVTSGFAEEEVAARFSGYGLAAFLPKPFTPASVEALLRTALHSTT